VTDPTTPPARRAGLLALLAVALAVRLLAAVVLDTPAAAEGATPWEWGGEAPTLAAALAEGRGFADPWRRPDGAWAEGTGPSAWLTPVYPALVALAMRLGGGMTRATAWWLIAAQALASSLTAVLLVRLGERLALPRAGRLAGWLFALFPLAVWNAVGVVWDTTLVALGVTAFLLALLAGGRRSAGLARSGLCFGGLVFLNPAPLAMLPAVWGWIALGERGPRGWVGALGRAALFTGAALCVCAPWMIRNRLVLGTWQLRPNFGVELRIGNHDLADGRPLPFLYHPSHVEAERELYVELGEAAYGRENTSRALAWIRAHPAGFLGLTARRAALFWWGELPGSDRRRSEQRTPALDPASWIKFLVYGLSGAGGLLALAWLEAPRDTRFLLAAALLGFGAPYYVTHVSERYRFPIDPLLVLLDAWLLLRFARGRRPGLDTGGGSVD